MPLYDRPRLANAGGALACLALLAYALYAEHVLGLEPCPLCMFQRVAIATLGGVFLLAALHGARGVFAYLYAGLSFAAAAAAVFVAARHVYIQSLPDGTVPACGATLDFMLETFPLLEVVRKVLTGGGECAEIDWSLLGLSMPAWVLLAALALGLWGLLVNGRAATGSPAGELSRAGASAR